MITLRRNQKGFTLVELAIVLIIIGIILGAVLKGRDLIQSAKQKQFYNRFVKTWEITVANYYDRTGKMLGDSTINGGIAATENGWFDNVLPCSTGTVGNALKRIGLDVPTTNTSVCGQQSIAGKYSGTQTVSLYLYERYSNQDDVNYNTLYMTSMPTDLAIALDRIVDGKADAHHGKFRRYPDNIAHANFVGNWPAADPSMTGGIAMVNTVLIIDLP